MKRNFLLIFLLLAFSFIALFSGWQLWNIFTEYKQGTDTYDRLEEFVTATPTPDPEAEKQEEPLPDDTVWPEVDFEALKAINEDVVGWIYLEGTKINYPIVKGPDNDYYLNRLYDKKVNGSGSIFMDYRNSGDFSDRNNVIYGHRMNNGSMFANLANYSNKEFFYEHPRILIMTPEKNYKLEVFSAYIASVDDNAWDLDFADDAAFETWATNVKYRTYFDNDVTPAKEDRVVTLSTCTYEFENARFIVHGVLR